MGRYHDERDRGALTLSHLYLLLGCALPLWWLLAVFTPRLDGCREGTTCDVQTLRCCSEESSPALHIFGLRGSGPGGSVAFLQAALAICGLVTVGVADALAAVFGVLWGRHRYVTATFPTDAFMVSTSRRVSRDENFRFVLYVMLCNSIQVVRHEPQVS